jgi:hypothetical protein
LVGAVSIVMALLLAAPALAQEDARAETTEVTFIHGIRGFLTDVYLDDELILAGFAPERVTEPLNLKAGRHRIDLRAADAHADSEPDVSKEFTVPAGGKLTAIAHWTGVEDCTITVFDESGDALAAGSGKLIARHAAATGDVELALDDQSKGQRLAPNMEIVESVAPGRHTVAVNDVESSRAVVERSRVPVPEGGARVVYLVGSAKEMTLGLLTQTIEGLESSPAGVPTGNSGLAGSSDAVPVLPIAALVAFAVMMLVGRRRKALTSGG